MLHQAKRTRVRFTFLLLISVTLVTLDLGIDGGPVRAVRSAAVDALSPARSAVGWVLSPVEDVVGGITRYGDLQEENARLRARMAALEGRVDANEGASAELSQLKELLELDDVLQGPTVAARVVSAPVSNVQHSIELDRGSRHGVAVDLPVVTGNGLVGRVETVSRTRSTVRLITDTASAVAVRLPSGDTAVAEGRGRDQPLVLTFVDLESDRQAEVGDLVVTSGLEGSSLPSYYPPGIVVGEVTAARADGGDADGELLVAPRVDLRRLAFVRVVGKETAP